MKYKIEKRALSHEEKIERAEIYNEFHMMEMVNPKEFAMEDIYDEKVDMRCSKCGYEETMEHDMLLELAGFMEIPTLYCTNCSKLSFKPKHIIK